MGQDQVDIGIALDRRASDAETTPGKLVLYRSKGSGGGTSAFHDPAPGIPLADRAGLEAAVSQGRSAFEACLQNDHPAVWTWYSAKTSGERDQLYWACKDLF